MRLTLENSKWHELRNNVTIFVTQNAPRRCHVSSLSFVHFVGNTPQHLSGLPRPQNDAAALSCSAGSKNGSIEDQYINIYVPYLQSKNIWTYMYRYCIYAHINWYAIPDIESGSIPIRNSAHHAPPTAHPLPVTPPNRPNVGGPGMGWGRVPWGPYG